MTKTYGIYGRTQAMIQVPLGDGSAYLMLEFTKGNPQPGAYYRPATYVSVSKTEQDMIERSPLFGNVIVLYKSYGSEESVVAPVDTKAEEEVETLEFPDVTNIDEARLVLKAQGAKASTLASEDAMKKFMVKKNIVFPNFEF